MKINRAGSYKIITLKKIIPCIFCLFYSYTGALPPSNGYFQQQVNYTIQVTLDDKKQELNAFETIRYFNHSNDTLRLLYFHLWPNAYSSNNTALARQLLQTKGKEKLFEDPALQGSIDSLDFRVENEKINWQLLSGQPDICILTLNHPLLPGDSIQISTPFRVKIPLGVTSRLGHIGTSYQISQWYPKPAVYDENGWHPMPYLDQGEFYSEFGNYDVSITLPSNYITGATGNLHNELEIEKLTKLAADTSWESSNGDRNTTFPPSSSTMKTLRFTEQHVHDFAWFADKRFHVLKGKVILPRSGREITTWAMFTDQEAELWKQSINYINNAISYFSALIDEYPYNNFTAVQSALNAGVGMEYPGITVIGVAENSYSLDEVITHEIIHNWFYSAAGSNERRYPYLDEGITSAYTNRYMNERYPNKKLWEIYLKKRKLAKLFHIENMPLERMDELEWLLSARNNLEQPINLPAPDYTTMNYGISIYNKAARGFEYLRKYLGDSVFDSSMQHYYLQWKYRHPQPEDLQNAFKSSTSKDLSWFFNDFLGTTRRMDYKIARLSKQNLLVKNKGQLISPFTVAALNGDSIIFEKWYDGFKSQKWIELPPGKYSELKIDPRHITPELFRLNNNYRMGRTFPKADPLNAHILFALDDPDKRTLLYIPAFNWNKEDGFMTGVLIDNGFMIPKPIEYMIMPFYTFKDPGVAGYGRFAWNIIPYNQLIRLATLSVEGAKFGAPGNQNYYTAKTGIEIFFRKENMTNPYQHMALGYYMLASDLAAIELMQKAGMNNYLQLGYQLEKASLINPFKALAFLETNSSYQKLSLELNYRYSYYRKKHGLDIRLFGGIMLKEPSEPGFYSFAPSGRSGREMYLYEGAYPDRFSEPSSSFWSRQMTLSEGGLVSPLNTILGYSNRLVSANISSNLPGFAGNIAIKPFLNLLLNSHGTETVHSSSFFWEAGLKAGIWNFFEIHVP
ncbi:MAG: M1 family metallopeptidase, partial [Candidatus Saccharibacteria bacterium]